MFENLRCENISVVKHYLEWMALFA